MERSVLILLACIAVVNAQWGAPTTVDPCKSALKAALQFQCTDDLPYNLQQQQEILDEIEFLRNNCGMTEFADAYNSAFNNCRSNPTNPCFLPPCNECVLVKPADELCDYWTDLYASIGYSLEDNYEIANSYYECYDFNQC